MLHGQARFDGTRIGVLTIADMIRDGDWSAREVADEYPDLSRADIDAALAYYDNHPEELTRWREAREVAIAGLRERSQRSSEPDPDSDDGADTEA